MSKSIFDGTIEIVVAVAGAYEKSYLEEAYAKDLAKFTEIIYEKLFDLENKSR